MSWLRRTTSRRRFLAGTAAIPAALALGSRPALARGAAPTLARPATPALAADLYAPRHLAWVWQFQHDGDRELIRDVLATHKLGLAIKTHDSTDWMSKYDDTADAISGPESIESLANYFAQAGVPLHAWSVLHGTDPVTEAQMASQALDAGAQSIFLDLEPHSGFWTGTTEDALRFGEELRRLQPSAFVGTSVDARPWELPNIPMAEFAQFTDAVAPQVYWSAFDTAGNLRKYREAGDDPGEEGMTPRFAMQSAARHLQQFGLPIHPIGDGTVDDGDQWSEFIDEAFASQAEALSVWRFGVAGTALWELLRDTPTRPLVYLVQPGDTLFQLALNWDTTVDAIAQTNGLTNVDYLFIGQELRIPRGGVTPTALISPAASGGAGSGGTYTVEPGDSLWSIAWDFDTTVDALAEANGITNTSLIGIGDTLVIP